MNEKDRIPLASLNPLAYNPRTISPEALAGLAASIRDGTRHAEGWNPADGYRLDSTITVNRQGNRIVGGHQRVRALREVLGQDWVYAADVTWIDVAPDSADEKARNVALNNPHIAGEWTPDLLSILDGLKVELPTFAEMRLDTLAADMAGWLKPTEDQWQNALEDTSSSERTLREMLFMLTAEQEALVKDTLRLAKADVVLDGQDFGNTRAATLLVLVERYRHGRG